MFLNTVCYLFFSTDNYGLHTPIYFTCFIIEHFRVSFVENYSDRFDKLARICMNMYPLTHYFKKKIGRPYHSDLLAIECASR